MTQHPARLGQAPGARIDVELQKLGLRGVTVTAAAGSRGQAVAAVCPVLERSGPAAGWLAFPEFVRAARRELDAALAKHHPELLAEGRITVEPVLEQRGFAAFAARAAGGRHRPLMTWHGATLEAAAKIVKHGK